MTLTFKPHFTIRGISRWALAPGLRREPDANACRLILGAQVSTNFEMWFKCASMGLYRSEPAVSFRVHQGRATSAILIFVLMSAASVIHASIAYAQTSDVNHKAQGNIMQEVDKATGWKIFKLRVGNTVARVAPQAGCNVFSIQVDDVEYLRVPDDLQRLRGVSYGNPVLYPTPNRIRGAKFQYDGETYEFQPNAGSNFIHGLVHSVPWDIQRFSTDGDAAEIVCQLPFAAGSERFELFPFSHTLRLKITVRSGKVRWTYEVENTGERPVPFGIGFHPYFVYQGQRAEAYLQVPATHLMESVQQLPTGQLLELAENPLDVRQPISLADFVVDDVYFGMTPDRPVNIDFRDARRRVTLAASDDFTHLVVYTPREPFLCVENQTCSTDAHNLAAQGNNNIAHLLICPPGKTLSGWVEYRFDSY